MNFLNNNFLQKEVTRKEFLLLIGLFIITITGISGIIKSLNSISQTKTEQGFGSGPYGR